MVIIIPIISHHQQVAGETEVKAQIKLRIRNSLKVPYLIIRSFSLTQKKTNMQFKALDQVVQVENKTSGQLESLSYKCAALDSFVPELMGASKVGGCWWVLVGAEVVWMHQLHVYTTHAYTYTHGHTYDTRATHYTHKMTITTRRLSWRTSFLCTRKTATGHLQRVRC